MHPKLAQLQEVLSQAIRGASAQELAQHPGGKWCATEILEHLNLTYTGTIKNLERCLAAGKPGVRADRKNNRVRRFLITHLGYFPSGRKAPERAQPRGTPPQQVLEDIFGNLASMDDVISRCESQFDARAPIADHPILGPLTAAEWRGFHATHGKHHARQIVRLRKSQSTE
jgi:hypothetical protein